jgi:hypothetical protein
MLTKTSDHGGVVAVVGRTTLFRHPSIRTLVEPAVRGARCSLGSVQPGAAISESVSKTRVVLAVVRTGRFRIFGSLKPHLLRECYLLPVRTLPSRNRSRRPEEYPQSSNRVLVTGHAGTACAMQSGLSAGLRNGS